MTRRHGRGRRTGLATLVLLATLMALPAMAAERDRPTSTSDIAVVLKAPAQALDTVIELFAGLFRAIAVKASPGDDAESPVPAATTLEVSSPGGSQFGCEIDPWG